MGPTKDDVIRIVGPTLRGIYRCTQVCYRDEPAGAGRRSVEVRFDSDASAEEMVTQLQQQVDTATDDVFVHDVGTFSKLPGSSTRGRVAGKVAVVTGAAQGFGLEIAQHLAAEGACVVLVDINEAGAAEGAAEICGRHGAGRALGLPINVTDTASIKAAVLKIVKAFGGIDLFVSNAGVVRPESVKTQPLKDFEFVTAVNYTGYFQCVQAIVPVLAVQHMADPAYTSDIIQINSKSGLQGSNRNAAYAGSKFGGVGLTQSFAMELIEDGIKVNAICPGNFFDGPLWSNPENGLFVQYLRAAKIPGAKTIEEVKRAYEAKVPMGRGCTTPDVMKAIYYLVEQQYETGQALPVTGGQVMMS